MNTLGVMLVALTAIFSFAFLFVLVVNQARKMQPQRLGKEPMVDPHAETDAMLGRWFVLGLAVAMWLGMVGL